MSDRGVAVIGLGLVGKALVRRLVEAGRPVAGFDVDAEARRAATVLGADVSEDAPAAVRGRPIVVLSLPDSAVVGRVLWEQGVAEALEPGAVVVDTTTGRPGDAADNHRRLGERGVRFVDATLVGSSAEIAEGRAVALVGDRAEGAGAYRAVIEAVAGQLFLLGGPGQGCRAKLVVNLALGLHRLVLAEALGLAMKAGMDGHAVLEALKSGGAYSRVMDTKGTRMIDGDFTPVARLRQHAKDVGLILELAAETGASVPLSEAHARILQKAIDEGWGDLDNAAVIKAFL